MPSPLQKIKRRIFSRKGGRRVRDYGDRNRIEASSAVFKNCRVQIFGNDNSIKLGPGTSVTDLEITILGSRNHIEIGAGAIFMKGTMWCSSDDGRISIGEQTTITDASLTLTEPKMSITLGRDCLVSWGVDVRCGDGHAIIDRATGEIINAARPIILGDHVWLAAHVQVLKGVSIGEGSVVGAHSVVTHDVPAHSIAAGIPAHIIRGNIAWRREEAPLQK